MRGQRVDWIPWQGLGTYFIYRMGLSNEEVGLVGGNDDEVKQVRPHHANCVADMRGGKRRAKTVGYMLLRLGYHTSAIQPNSCETI
jgi:hypothetical protein